MDSIVYIVDNGQKVQAKLIRRFSLGSKIYAEIQVVDEDRTRNVLNSDLLVKDEFYQRKNEESEFSDDNSKSELSSQDDKFNIDLENGVIEINSESGSSISISEDGIRVDGDIVLENKVTSSHEDVVGSEVKPTVKVFGTNAKGKRFSLGDIEELVENANVKKFKLDPEAIKRVLDGKQKQHKGFTFDIE